MKISVIFSRSLSANCREKQKSLAESLKYLFKTQLMALQPDKHFLSGLAAAAATAGSQVSPFSTASANVRNIHINMLKTVVNNAAEKIDPLVKKELPPLLWLIQMALIFFWLQDKSKNSTNTMEPIDTLMDILASFIKLQKNPLASSFKKTFITLARQLMTITENGP